MNYKIFDEIYENRRSACNNYGDFYDTEGYYAHHPRPDRELRIILHKGFANGQSLYDITIHTPYDCQFSDILKLIINDFDTMFLFHFCSQSRWKSDLIKYNNEFPQLYNNYVCYLLEFPEFIASLCRHNCLPILDKHKNSLIHIGTSVNNQMINILSSIFNIHLCNIVLDYY